MFTLIVAWFSFVFGSLYILLAVIDSIFQFSTNILEKALGIRRSYATGATAYILAVWFLSGWFLFG